MKLSNVNGRIEIMHANDNRPMSPAKNLERERARDDSERARFESGRSRL